MRKLIASILMLFMLLGCDQQALFEKFIPKNEEAIAKEVISNLAARNFPAVKARLDRTLQSSDVDDKLEGVAKLIPAGAPRSVHTVGASTSHVDDITTYSLTIEYEYDSAWILCNVVLRRVGDAVTVAGVHVKPRNASLETENAFSFEGKGWIHYLIFALVIGIPVFIIYAFVVCVRTTLPKRKWLWLLFIAFGFCAFTLNWTTGAWSVEPLSFLLLGAGVARASMAAPFIFSVAFPLGAVIFLAKRRSLRPGDET